MNLFEKAAELEKRNQAFAMVTITKSEGSTPRSQAKMIVLPDGTTFGTVGGGASEYEAMKRARTCIAEKRNAQTLPTSSNPPSPPTPSP